MILFVGLYEVICYSILQKYYRVNLTSLNNYKFRDFFYINLLTLHIKSSIINNVTLWLRVKEGR